MVAGAAAALDTSCTGQRSSACGTKAAGLERLGRIPFHEIATEAGISKSKLQEVRARLGLSARPDHAAQLRRWYEQGDTIAVIAQRLGAHPDTVRRQLIRAGITPRSPGRQPAR